MRWKCVTAGLICEHEMKLDGIREWNHGLAFTGLLFFFSFYIFTFVQMTLHGMWCVCVLWGLEALNAVYGIYMLASHFINFSVSYPSYVCGFTT